MDIKDQIIGNWKSVMETYEFFDENNVKIQPDQISSNVDLEIKFDDKTVTALELNEKPVASTYEIHKELLDYFLVVFVGTETQVSNLKLYGNNLTLVYEPTDMQYQENGIWKRAHKTTYTVEFTRN